MEAVTEVADEASGTPSEAAVERAASAMGGVLVKLNLTAMQFNSSVKIRVGIEATNAAERAAERRAILMGADALTAAAATPLPSSSSMLLSSSASQGSSLALGGFDATTGAAGNATIGTAAADGKAFSRWLQLRAFADQAAQLRDGFKLTGPEDTLILKRRSVQAKLKAVAAFAQTLHTTLTDGDALLELASGQNIVDARSLLRADAASGLAIDLDDINRHRFGRHRHRFGRHRFGRHP